MVICFAIAFYATGWSEPTTNPPDGNADTPINTGSEMQTKEGSIVINNGLAVGGDVYVGQDILMDSVTLKGDGSVSTGLNADKVDGKNASDFKDVCVSISQHSQVSGGTCTATATCPTGMTVKSYCTVGLISNVDSSGAAEWQCNERAGSCSGNYCSVSQSVPFAFHTSFCVVHILCCK